jgi:hypothetical protein
VGGAAGSTWVGVKAFGPVGLILFSVGDGGAAGDVVVAVVVVVVVVEVSGAFSSSLAQDAVKLTIPTIARPPATAPRRRARRGESMFIPILMACYQLIRDPKPV